MRIVYAGAGLSGRSASVASVLRAVGQPVRGIHLQVGEDAQKLILDGCPVSLKITVARALAYYERVEERLAAPLIRAEIDDLQAADALIFVVDSQVARRAANEFFLDQLERDLASRRIRLADKPIVIQANKRDLPDIDAMAAIIATYQRTELSAVVESIATKDIGTVEAVRSAIALAQR